MYNAIVRSVLDYACPAFVSLNAGLSNDSEKVQRRAMKIIYFNSAIPTDISTVAERRKKLAVNFFNNMHHSAHILNNLCPNVLHNTRKFQMPMCKTERRLRSFILYIIMYSNQN